MSEHYTRLSDEGVNIDPQGGAQTGPILGSESDITTANSSSSHDSSQVVVETARSKGGKNGSPQSRDDQKKEKTTKQKNVQKNEQKQISSNMAAITADSKQNEAEPIFADTIVIDSPPTRKSSLGNEG